MNPGMSMGMSLGLGQRLEMRPELDIILALRLELEDPVETAERLYESASKVRVPIAIGDHVVVVRAALISQEDMESLFQEEKFAGIIGRNGQNYQFINKSLNVPHGFSKLAPTLMAFHCLACINVKSYGDVTGTMKQYQAIALELAYAQTILAGENYAKWETWRREVERTDFFSRPDWGDIVAKVHSAFSSLLGAMQVNAKDARFSIMCSSDEKFRLTFRGARREDGTSIPCSKRVHGMHGRLLCRPDKPKQP